MALPDSETQRSNLVEQLRKNKNIETEAVAVAFLSVPREAFVPQAPLEEVYRDIAIGTRYNRLGEAVSSSSQPTIMAIMLEMLQVEAGHNVLEIGVGTGYNAGLLKAIVGPTGKVTALEIQEDVAAEAMRHFKNARLDVHVVSGDGSKGLPEEAPFDRIIVTASCGDIPERWWEQLKPDGILVLPLARGPLQVVTALRRVPVGFVSIRCTGGGFMPMQGDFAPRTKMRFLGPRVDLGILATRPTTRLDAGKLFDLLITQPSRPDPGPLKAVFSGRPL